ncbi:hypothetical protein [Oryza sativa Japonica Group]|uniref:Uncharacterized protein n=1 Tax=Oryza sativa subsp. japonica TaxID=39947 RepID=Q5ZB33_ORYSJ|nr:hypothetical protein [Oryza sativa Japonica Group]
MSSYRASTLDGTNMKKQPHTTRSATSWHCLTSDPALPTPPLPDNQAMCHLLEVAPPLLRICLRTELALHSTAMPKNPSPSQRHYPPTRPTLERHPKLEACPPAASPLEALPSLSLSNDDDDTGQHWRICDFCVPNLF